MKKVVIQANAKINISLVIEGLLSNGYHNLDTIMCPIDLYDIVTLVKRKDSNVTCQGLDIPDKQNIAVISAKMIVEEMKTSGVDIYIEKNIPMSAGLGGSSADCAGVLFGMSALYNINYGKIRFLSRNIGSDVAFLMSVYTGAMRARGRGEILTSENMKKLHIVIAKPYSGVSTSEAYELYDEKYFNQLIHHDNSKLLELISANLEFDKYLVNYLYKPAIELNDEIEPLFNIMKKLSYNYAVMSGSGSSVIAICKSEEDANRIMEGIPDKYLKFKTKTVKDALYIK